MSGLDDWMPLSQRVGAAPPDETLLDGVPAHLWDRVVEWLSTYGDSQLGDLALRLRIPFKGAEFAFAFDPRGDRIKQFMAGISKHPEPERALLDAVDGVLHAHRAAASAQRSATDRQAAEEHAVFIAVTLDQILTLGGSKWITTDDGGALVERVAPAVADSLAQVLAETGQSSASTHLRAAWTGAYGRNPNPGDAYGEAVKAVESAAAPVVEPNNEKATLGTILGHLKRNAAKWRFAIDPGDIAPVIAAAQALWDGQTDRHGGNKPTKAVEPEAAQAAVLLAATLVHWFAAGLVTRG